MSETIEESTARRVAVPLAAHQHTIRGYAPHRTLAVPQPGPCCTLATSPATPQGL